MRWVPILVVAAVLVPGSAGVAQEAGSVPAGRSYVMQNCASCHAVEAYDLDSPNPDAPSFASVVTTPGMTDRAIAVWLQTSHPTMPNLMVAPEDRDNVVAYIMSIRPVEPQ